MAFLHRESEETTLPLFWEESCMLGGGVYIKYEMKRNIAVMTLLPAPVWKETHYLISMKF